MILIGIAKLKFIRCLMQGKFSLFAKLIFSVIIFSLIISTIKKSWPFKSYVTAIKKTFKKTKPRFRKIKVSGELLDRVGIAKKVNKNF